MTTTRLTMTPAERALIEQCAKVCDGMYKDFCAAGCLQFAEAAAQCATKIRAEISATGDLIVECWDSRALASSEQTNEQRVALPCDDPQQVSQRRTEAESSAAERALIEPDAWFFSCRKPGKFIQFASINPDTTEHWPLDQWTEVKVEPLYRALSPSSEQTNEVEYALAAEIGALQKEEQRLLDAVCVGNHDCEIKVRCQSYEASEQNQPCPAGRCVMAEPESSEQTNAAGQEARKEETLECVQPTTKVGNSPVPAAPHGKVEHGGRPMTLRECMEAEERAPLTAEQVEKLMAYVRYDLTGPDRSMTECDTERLREAFQQALRR